jgi:hypothetical protein
VLQKPRRIARRTTTSHHGSNISIAAAAGALFPHLFTRSGAS